MKYTIILLAILLASCTQTEAKVFSQKSGTGWTQETQKKYDKLVELGFEKDVAKVLIKECKATAKNPVNCIKLGASVLAAESSKGTRCFRNNCFGMGGGSISYTTRTEGIKDWVKKYNKFWFNQKAPSSFYPVKGGVSVTRYCTSEESSNSSIGCPNGRSHAYAVFNKLNFD